MIDYKKNFPNLFNPLLLKNGLEIPMRLYFAPMGIDMASNDGCFSDELSEFYKGIMDGGCNFIILGNASISPHSRLNHGGLCLYNNRHVSSLSPFLKMANTYNKLIGVQLQHYGPQGNTSIANMPVLTASGIPCKAISKRDPNYQTKIMDEEDIANVIAEFAMSAKLAKIAGAKLIQLQASNGYLLSSFLSPYTNLRTDPYGGSEANRARLLLEVIKAIKVATNDEIAISVRLGIDDMIGDKGIKPDKIVNIVIELEKIGIDAITCSMCIGETFGKFLNYSKEMDDYLCNGVKFIKSKTSLPVGFAGFVDSLEKAETLIKDGIADFIGMTRAIFADNDLINKTLSGKVDRINNCLWDGNCFKDKSNPNFSRVYCCVNPKYLRPKTVN